jgi:hypothetical protein
MTVPGYLTPNGHDGPRTGHEGPTPVRKDD